ncbi:MscS family membrane protein [Methanococcus voltae PS]|uniref:MscS family membrane protein n=1 Tax=Methanococcus voltae PS TaxID=523842 RepID=A0ABT2EWR2_METVO|nr:mechanosensitive ion channel family protein [Methanococcus voltae]MCS3922397.1 MscS family membrane protein [Methanococcus voltae PS]
MDYLNFMLFGNTIFEYVMLIVYIFLGVIAGKVLKILIEKYAKKLVGKTKTVWDDVVIDAVKLPLMIVVFAIFFRYGMLSLNLTPNLITLVNESVNVVYILALLIFTLKFVDDVFIYWIIPRAEKSESKLDDQIIPPVRKLLKIFIVIGGILLMLANLQVDISALLAGICIGGLAVALASQDTLENFLGGLIIISDKTFLIHDWIKWGGGEGVVEEVGIRSTKVRTFGDTIITVPNGDLVKTEVENYSARRKRQVKTTIGVTYSTTPEKMVKAKEIIKDILDEHHGVVDPIRVSFTEFGNFSLNIRVEYFVREFGFDYFLTTVDEVNTKIMTKFRDAGIDFAFPTQTLHLTNDDDALNVNFIGEREQ